MICVRFLKFLAKGRWFRRPQLTSSPAVIDEQAIRMGYRPATLCRRKRVFFFSRMSSQALEPNQLSVSACEGLSPEVKRPELGLTTHHHLITKLNNVLICTLFPLPNPSQRAQNPLYYH